MNLNIERLLKEIETLIGQLAPSAEAAHRDFEHNIRKLGGTDLYREFNRNLGDRDFHAAQYNLRRMKRRANFDLWHSRC